MKNARCSCADAIRVRLAIAVLPILLAGGTAEAAEDAPSVTARHHRDRPHAAYVELLGKGGLFGLGYDYQFHDRLAIGGTAAYYGLDGQRVLAFSAYVALYPLGGDRNRWFVHAGPQLVRLSTPSPVPEWPGESSTGLGAELATGYELRAGMLFRAGAMVTIGKNGFAPWPSATIGWSF